MSERRSRRILVTGGAGFIGSALIRHLLRNTQHEVLNVDKLTYAGNLNSLAEVSASPRYAFRRLDICDSSAVGSEIEAFQPDVIVHLAAESHVDRSINGPAAFIETNIRGTFSLLEAARAYFVRLSENRRREFLFHHVSTDEVFGDLHGTNDLFTEATPYAPSSPYSATKAASDHLVRSWHRTFGLPVLVSNCSNNYGPYHFPEKLIPHIILSALANKPLPVYGDGQQVRDWLFVEDHARALTTIFSEGKTGETYLIGGFNERRNLDVVESICSLLDELAPHRRAPGRNSFSELITFVTDRPGHDARYAIDATKLKRELGWEPRESFETGLQKTVAWYLANESWWRDVLDGSYRLDRLGLH